MAMTEAPVIDGPSEEQKARSDAHGVEGNEGACNDQQADDNSDRRSMADRTGMSDLITIVRLCWCRPSATANSQPMAGFSP